MNNYINNEYINSNSYMSTTGDIVNGNTINNMMGTEGGNDDSNNRQDYGLWRAVIMQSIVDATNNSQKSSEQAAKHQALSWLKGDSADFKQVCDMAGLTPFYVTTKAKEAIRDSTKWKRPSTKKRACDKLELNLTPQTADQYLH